MFPLKGDQRAALKVTLITSFITHLDHVKEPTSSTSVSFNPNFSVVQGGGGGSWVWSHNLLLVSNIFAGADLGWGGGRGRVCPSDLFTDKKGENKGA